MVDQNEVIIGIDLGTTNSCVAVYENGQPVVIENEDGERITASLVGLINNEFIIGNILREASSNDAGYIVSNAKRLIGLEY